MIPSVAEKTQRAPSRIPTKIQTERVSPARLALAELAPGCGCKRLVPFFDGRASDVRIAQWLSGSRSLPQWAVELIQAKIDQRKAKLEWLRSEVQKQTGPGSAKAGAYALARWRASRKI